MLQNRSDCATSDGEKLNLGMISVQSLCREFQQGRTTVRAVDALTFSVQPGEVYGLLGPNGAGKTTTLRMILGLLPPTSGDASIAGFSVRSEPQEIKRRIGLVSTSAGLYQWLTPEELLMFFAELYGVSPQQARSQIDVLCELLDLGRFRHQRCGTLSTGQRQRVTLARALIHDPPVVLLDEPTRGLDIIGQKTVFEFIDRLRESQKAVVLCTHRLDEAAHACTRLGLLHRGRLRHEGTMTELQEEQGCSTLYEMFLHLFREEGEA